MPRHGLRVRELGAGGLNSLQEKKVLYSRLITIPLIFVLLASCSVKAPLGRISADPALPDISNGPGTTTIRWEVFSQGIGQVYVAVDGRPEVLFAQGPQGEAEATWIVAGQHYRFRLYQGTERKVILAETSLLVPVPPERRHAVAAGRWPSVELRYFLTALVASTILISSWLRRRGKQEIAQRFAASGAVLMTVIVLLAVNAVPPRDLLKEQPYPDAAEYADAARYIAQGKGYVTQHGFGSGANSPQPIPALHPPGYSLALAPFAVFYPDYPENIQSGARYYTLLYVLAAVALAWRMGGPLAATILAGLVGVSPYAYSSAALVMSDTFGATLLLVAVWLSVRAGRVRTALLGAVAGSLVLIRLNMLLEMAALVLTHPAGWRRRALMFAMPGLLVLGTYQWAAFGSPWTTGQAVYVPNLKYIDPTHAYTRFVGHDDAFVWGDNLSSRFEAWLCGCTERWPLTRVPNLVFYPALLFGLIWTFGPPLASVPGLIYAVRHRHDRGARVIAVIVLINLAFFAVSVMQARRYLAGSATLLLVLSAVAIARWLESRWSVRHEQRNALATVLQRPTPMQNMFLGIVGLALTGWLAWPGGLSQALPSDAASASAGLGLADTSSLLTLPPGFDDHLVASLSRPTDLASTPDGRFLVTRQTGQIHVLLPGTGTSTVALDLSDRICTNWERGVNGVAVDPDFTSNHYVYVYYTYNKHNECPHDDINNPNNPVNRLVRFSLPPGNQIDPSTEIVLVDNIPQLKGTHNAGDLNFGADGWLYVSVGDGGKWVNATDLSNLAGKILRVGAAGTLPNDNPYTHVQGARRCGDPTELPPGTGPCLEIFAHGLRNPFRFAFQPGSDVFFINDVGQDSWEEINIGNSGANYGWNVREGPCPFPSRLDCDPSVPSGYDDPVYYYHHSTGCYAITGSAFVPAGIWPAEFDNAYLFGDYGCGKIWRLVPGDHYTATVFASGLGTNGLVSMIFGPYGETQALYYTTYANGGQVRRITFMDGNRPPKAVASADPAYGASVPLTVTLSAAGSLDPDADDSLVFDWDFGDGQVLTATASLTITHAYAPAGVYTATLVARDNRGAASAPVSVRIDAGNTPPQPHLAWLSPQAPFAVGDLLEWQASATDPEDGDLPPNALSWEAWLHHIDETFPDNAHVHPLLPPSAGQVISLTAPGPEDLGATALSFIELQLTATDSWGLPAMITQAVVPNRVPVAFQANLPQIEMRLEGLTVTLPYSLTSWQNAPLALSIPLQTDPLGQRLALAAWSDSPVFTATRTFLTPASPASLSATLALTDVAPVPLLEFISPLVWPAGGAPYTLTVVGRYFTHDAVVQLNGASLPTTFASHTTLHGQVGLQAQGLGGLLAVTVYNPGPGGGASNAIVLPGPWAIFLPWISR
jgi:glucose/arabinose dehydrogenase